MTSRRGLLIGGASLAAAALAGCLGDDDGSADEPVEPVDLTGGVECAVCGMVIEEHHGPAGQLFYGDEDPVPFDSVGEMIVYHEDRRARGDDLRAAFVTDYSRVDYRLDERDGEFYISSHAEREVFADVADVSFVVDSPVQGAMGDDHFPFSDAEEASAFADEHGGEVRSWDDLVADS